MGRGTHWDSTLYGQESKRLTPREAEVAELLCSIPFLSLDEIRRKMGISMWTLKRHRESIARKLDMSSMDGRAMALYLIRSGHVDVTAQEELQCRR